MAKITSPTGLAVHQIVTQAGPQLRKGGMGLMVLVFEYGEGGEVSYASTASRDDGVAAIVEWLGRQEPAVLKQAVQRWQEQGRLGPGAEKVQ